MKRLLTLLFAAMVVFSLTMPAFAQETPGGTAAPKAEKKKKAPKEKKKKKGGTESGASGGTETK